MSSHRFQPLTPLVVLAVACLVVGAPAWALTEYERKTMLQYLDGPDLARQTSIFDGKQFVEGVELKRAKTYYTNYVRALNTAIGKWNGFPKGDIATADAKPFLQRIQEATAWAKAMEVALKPLEQAQKAAIEAGGDVVLSRAPAADKAAHDEKCRRFGEETVFVPELLRRVEPMIGLMFDREFGLAKPEDITDHREALEQVAKICAKSGWEGLFAYRCHWMLGRVDMDRPKTPKHWCDAAARKDELLKKAVVNYIQKSQENLAGLGAEAKDVTQKEGWLPIESWTTYEEVTTVTQAEREKMLAKYRPALEAAGLGEADAGALGEARQKHKAELKAKIDELAPTWTNPPAEATDYSAQLAVKQVKAAHKGSPQVKAWLSRAEWKVFVNSLTGVPLRRTRPGYVQFQLPGEPWCQLRSYTLTEDYMGGGKFQKAGGVDTGYVRFQKCQ